WAQVRKKIFRSQTAFAAKICEPTRRGRSRISALKRRSAGRAAFFAGRGEGWRRLSEPGAALASKRDWLGSPSAMGFIATGAQDLIVGSKWSWSILLKPFVKAVLKFFAVRSMPAAS